MKMSALLFIALILAPLGLLSLGFIMGYKVKENAIKKDGAILHAKKGDMVYIPENCEVTGIGLYEYTGGKIELVQKVFIDTLTPTP